MVPSETKPQSSESRDTGRLTSSTSDTESSATTTTSSTSVEKEDDEFIEVLGELRKRRRPEPLPSPSEQHPFFIKEAPSADQPLPPLLEALQQIKYSPETNSPLELAQQYKQDGLFQYKLAKYRMASSLFKEALTHADKATEETATEFKATLRNNWGMCEYHLENYRQALIQFKAALSLKPDYIKSLKKAVDCCRHLSEWEEGLQWCKNGLALGVPEIEEEMKTKGLELKREQKKQEVRKKLEEVQAREDSRLKDILKNKIIRTRQIKCQNPDFLTDEKSKSMDIVVKFSKEDEDCLLWPVLFYYPECSQSDFIEEFNENDEFLPHLEKMLDEERPSWDQN